MKKELTVHIGAGKCGSSAIQTFLGKNKNLLLDQGILIPGEKLDVASDCTGNQIWFFQNGIGKPGFKESVGRRLRRLHSHMTEVNCDRLIVSAENLINPEGFSDLFMEAKNLFNVKIIAYVRRQDDYLISAWQQWYLKYFDSFDEYVNSMGSRVNWYSALESWENLYGVENIHVRIFEKNRMLNGSAIDDFAHLNCIDIQETSEVTEKINRSLDEKFNGISNKYRSELFDSIHDNRFYQFLADIYGEVAFKNYSGSKVLSLAQRELLVSRYESENEKLREKYLTEDSDSFGVFSPPCETDCVYPLSNDNDNEFGYSLVGMFAIYKSMNKRIVNLEHQITMLQNSAVAS